MKRVASGVRAVLVPVEVEGVAVGVADVVVVVVGPDVLDAAAVGVEASLGGRLWGGALLASG